MRRRWAKGVVLLIAALAAAACSGSSRSFSPNAPTAPSAPTTPFATSLRITGNASLAALGETSQLTAVAIFSDGATKDVTSEARWLSDEASVVDVSAGGVVSVVGFGRATIRAQYQSQSAQLVAVATPPGTFVAFGRVREPGMGGVDVVRVLDSQSGRSTITTRLSGESGRYSIGGLIDSRLTFEREGYEGRQYEVQPNEQTDVPMQRVVRLTARESVTPPQLAPHDLSYVVGGDRCEPCKLIRITTPAKGSLQVTLKWNTPGVALTLWLGVQRFSGMPPELTADAPVNAGEVVVHVGVLNPPGPSPTNYVPFTLSASLN